MTKEDDSIDKWLNFLEPENLKNSLIFSSLYIATFESFKDYIIEEVKFFYNTGFSGEEYTFSEEYKLNVISKDKSLTKATLIWLKENGAINDGDIESFNELRKCRNKLSHELMTLLFDGLQSEISEKFVELLNLRIKIEKWWIINIEIPTNPDFDSSKEVSEDDVLTSSQALNQIILDILSGDEEKASFYLNEMKKYLKSKTST